MVRDEIIAAQANLQRALEREAELVFRSSASGRFIVPNAADLPGRYVNKGSWSAMWCSPGNSPARVALLQDDIAMVRQSTREVEVMLADWGSSPVQARIRREVPGASLQLPTAALGARRRPIAVDPRDKQGVTR
jgi:putative peptide zinc metalloprotease protein